MLSYIKYFVVFFNFLYGLLGVLILGLSAYLWWNSQNYLYLNQVDWYYVSPFIVLLILGGVMSFVGFVGCCGTVRESFWLLCTYILLCVTMCIACGASLLWDIHNERTVRDRITSDTLRLFQVDYGLGDTYGTTEMLVDRIQRDFRCCGWWEGPYDWLNAGYNKANKNGLTFKRGIKGSEYGQWLWIPHSCCHYPSSYECERETKQVTDIRYVENMKIIYKTGCGILFEQFIRDIWQWIVIIGGVLIGVQLFALIIACVSCFAISRVGDK